MKADEAVKANNEAVEADNEAVEADNEAVKADEAAEANEMKVEAIEVATRRGVRGPTEEPTSTSSRDTSRPGTTSGR